MPSKYQPVTVILMIAGPLFAAAAMKWPQYWPAILATLVLAKYIAIFTHRPGAEQTLALLTAEAKKDAPPSNVTNIVEVEKS